MEKKKKQTLLITDLYLIYFMIPNIIITYRSMISSRIEH